MVLNPLFPTDIAKLISALAGHVVAALIFLKHHLAFVTPLEEIVVFKEKNSVLITTSTVPWQQALPAERNTADWTLNLFI